MLTSYFYDYITRIASEKLLLDASVEKFLRVVGVVVEPQAKLVTEAGSILYLPELLTIQHAEVK
jgi:hypothetical protein